MKKLLIVFFLCSLITSVFAEPPVDTANFVILNQTAQKSCFSSTIQFLNKSNSFSYHTYVWDFGDGSKKDTVSFKTDSITQGKKNHTYTKDGQFTVVLTILDTTAGKKVVLAQKRRANFILVYRPSSQDFTYKINDFETFDYTFKIPEDFKPFDKTVWQYEWDFGDNGSTELTDSTAIFHHFTEENKIKGYNVKLKIKLNVDKVTLTTKKTEECFDTIVVNVKVKDGFFKNDSLKSTPLVPNIFTPNKDGVNEEIVLSLEDTTTANGLKGNDFFVVKTNGEQIFTLWVYDRWGALVYKTEGKTITWQGKSTSGDDLNSGVYYYVIESNAKDKRHKTAGAIHLFRD